MITIGILWVNMCYGFLQELVPFRSKELRPDPKNFKIFFVHTVSSNRLSVYIYVDIKQLFIQPVFIYVYK